MKILIKHYIENISFRHENRILFSSLDYVHEVPRENMFDYQRVFQLSLLCHVWKWPSKPNEEMSFDDYLQKEDSTILTLELKNKFKNFKSVIKNKSKPIQLVSKKRWKNSLRHWWKRREWHVTRWQLTSFNKGASNLFASFFVHFLMISLLLLKILLDFKRFFHYQHRILQLLLKS